MHRLDQGTRQAHNLKVVGSNPTPATNLFNYLATFSEFSRVCRSIAGPIAALQDNTCWAIKPPIPPRAAVSGRGHLWGAVFSL